MIYPETNIVPEKMPSQKETSNPTIHFQVLTVSFRECIMIYFYSDSMLRQLVEPPYPVDRD